MKAPHLELPPPTDFAAARLQFVELYGSTAVMNTYLKIAVVCLSLTGVSLSVGIAKAYEAAHHVKPIVIRINEVGRAEAISYDSLDYSPREAEIKYFLIQFVEHHYSRMRATVRDNYARSLYFLDGPLADALIQANKKTPVVEEFLANPTEEIEIHVNNMSIEDLRNPPYRATVDFEKIHFGSSDRSESKREKFIAHFVFVVRDGVPNAMIPVNPLGLAITYFREDQAFQ